MTSPIEPAQNILPTLAPQLEAFACSLDGFLKQKSTLDQLPDQKNKLTELNADLAHKAKDLAHDRPALIVLLMGGTGVGKSTLLNALAKGKVAVAAFTRPTTRNPVVYHHKDLPLERLPEPLQKCQLVAHDRPALEHKILVDTPDLDSNEPGNREKLAMALPFADVVLYVGSQEKYHDAAGWELFLEQRQRRAFAFILNKWDRCIHGLTSGKRPDDDLIQDLQKDGFTAPLIFRTCAQAWVEANGQPQALPEGEQFKQLETWLEHGLNRLEIQAIKARGLEDLLFHLAETLHDAMPPDIARAAQQTQSAWQQTLRQEAELLTQKFMIKLDQQHREIEKRFTERVHQQFRGFTASFMHILAKLQYLGTKSSTLTAGLSSTLGLTAAEQMPNVTTDNQANFKDTSWLSPHHIQTLVSSLANRLLVQADQNGVPSKYLNPMLEAVHQPLETASFGGTLDQVLQETEKNLIHAAGFRQRMQRGLIVLGDVLPPLVLVLSIGWLLYDYFLKEPRRTFYFFDLFLPFMAVLFVLIIFYFLIQWILPIRWSTIRSQLVQLFQSRIQLNWEKLLLDLPMQLARTMEQERTALYHLEERARAMHGWLKSKENASQVAFLYQK